jgi:hypothetical protein
LHRCWADVKTSLSNKHEAVNTKYETQQIVDLKNVKIPEVTMRKLDGWFHKIHNLPFANEVEEEMQSEEMP